MALYKYAQNLRTSNHEAFDKTHTPGANTPLSGIYRCEGCGDKIASNAAIRFPKSSSA
jgi:hypothetical protein